MKRFASASGFALLALLGFASAGIPQGTQPPAAVGKATFNHDLHAAKLKFECKSCHHETNAASLKMPHKDYFDDFWIDCRICHTTGGKAVTAPRSCSTCHHSSPANVADETLSAKVVIHKQCASCHEIGKGVAASRNCAKCHATAGGKSAGRVTPGASPKKG